MARRASNTPKKKEKTQHNTTHEIQTDTELTLEDEEFHGERWIKKNEEIMRVHIAEQLNRYRSNTHENWITDRNIY